MRSILILVFLLGCSISFIAGDYLSDVRFKYLPLCDRFGDLRVVDGDTIECGGIREKLCEYGGKTSDGNPIRCTGRMLRIEGIDAPEPRLVNCPEEKKLGLKASCALEKLIGRGNCTVAWTGKWDTLGRYLSTVTCGGIRVSKTLVANRFARPWDFKNEEKPDWCKIIADDPTLETLEC